MFQKIKLTASDTSTIQEYDTGLSFEPDDTNDIINQLTNISADTTTGLVTLAGSGIVFDNTYGSGVTAAFRSAIIAAENYIQSQFNNSVTFNISFNLGSLSATVSGENSFSDIRVSYAELVAALTSHATTPDDFAAIKSLPTTDPSGFPSGGEGFVIPLGEARILGLAGNSTGIDDAVILNDNLPWTFGTDAVGVIEHEISEGEMGRISGLGIQNNAWAPMDLFRYSAPGVHDYTGGEDGLLTYFAVDGTTLLTQFHNSVNTSGVFDGGDLADWDHTVGDAFGPSGPGSSGTISAVDLQVLDILGWTQTSSTPTPTPTPPIISAIPANQTINLGQAIDPFSGMTVSDTNENAMDTGTITKTGTGTLNGVGLTEINSTQYTLAECTPAIFTTDLDGVNFTPDGAGVAMFTLTVRDNEQEQASASTTVVVAAPPPTPSPTFTPSTPSPALPIVNLTDTTTGTTSDPFMTAYSGPVAGIVNQFIDVSPDSLNIVATTSNVFLHSGAGNDALQVTSGTNVLDGSTGSNFFVGGTGFDTFFVDDRGATASIWSTVVNFHSDDNATFWGVVSNDFTLTEMNNRGASGYTGLTFGFSASDKPDANLTLAGFSTADLSNGKLTITYGSTPANNGVAGSNYMLIHAN